MRNWFRRKQKDDSSYQTKMDSLEIKEAIARKILGENNRASDVQDRRHNDSEDYDGPERRLSHA